MFALQRFTFGLYVPNDTVFAFVDSICMHGIANFLPDILM